jgi:6,7-dimethyl-8-ribityllumazine synthase
MATKGNHLSVIHQNALPSGKGRRVAIACAEWNSTITDALLQGALDVLQKAGISKKDIVVVRTPGAFELPLACQWLLQEKKIEGVIAIGSVIQGETRHFDFVCQGVTQGIMEVGLKYNKPAVFCVLTDNNLKQAKDRSGGRHGNKGAECAAALLKMLKVRSSIH